MSSEQAQHDDDTGSADPTPTYTVRWDEGDGIAVLRDFALGQVQEIGSFLHLRDVDDVLALVIPTHATLSIFLSDLDSEDDEDDEDDDGGDPGDGPDDDPTGPDTAHPDDSDDVVVEGRVVALSRRMPRNVHELIARADRTPARIRHVPPPCVDDCTGGDCCDAPLVA